MDRETNYVAVGAFVVVVLAMATVFVLWYTNTHERREYQRYEVYFSGSVSGLNPGSTVRYLGVNVGRVTRVVLDPRADDRVEALIDIEKATPVTHDTLARLTAQGVTGLLFIDLSRGGPNAASASPEVPSQQYPVIRSVPSNFDLFLSGLPELVGDAIRVTHRLNVVLDDDNVAAVRATLANMRAATQPLPATARDAAQLVAELRAVVAEAQRVMASANRLVGGAEPALVAAAAHLREVSEHLAAASDRVDALIARHEPNLDRLAGHGLDQLQDMVRDVRDAAGEVRALARSLRDEPSLLLYEHRAAGVEIPP
jgi:phospholipid/cholesterol/gamma-HCH transport system substrate-binding protein